MGCDGRRTDDEQMAPLQHGNRVTSGGSVEVQQGPKTPQVPGIGSHYARTIDTLSQSLVSVTKVRIFTLDLNGCRTGGEEDGGK